MNPQHNTCSATQLVQIEINGKKVELSSGQWFIYDLKEMACVPANHEFAEIKDCSFFEFGHNDRTHIKGGENFKSYPCKGTNS